MRGAGYGIWNLVSIFQSSDIKVQRSDFNHVPCTLYPAPHKCNLRELSASKGQKSVINPLKLNTMIELTPVLVLLVIFGFIYGVVHLGVRKKERMALLERGADPALFHDNRPGIAGIRYGLLLIGVAVGILLGNIIEATTCLESEVSYFSMIFLFGGLALVISYFIEKQQSRKRE